MDTTLVEAHGYTGKLLSNTKDLGNPQKSNYLYYWLLRMDRLSQKRPTFICLKLTHNFTITYLVLLYFHDCSTYTTRKRRSLLCLKFGTVILLSFHLNNV